MLCIHSPVLVRSARVSADRSIDRVPIEYPLCRAFYRSFSESEGELTLCAGDYLLVWGSGEPQSGYFDAELLDGRRGLVPASYVQRLIGTISIINYIHCIYDS